MRRTTRSSCSRAAWPGLPGDATRQPDVSRAAVGPAPARRSRSCGAQGMRANPGRPGAPPAARSP
eukprot:102228-Lingulodinium_polyedra.AAC.1